MNISILGVKNVKIQETYEKSGEMKIQGGGSSDPKLGIYPFLLKSIHIKNAFINLPESQLNCPFHFNYIPKILKQHINKTHLVSYD